jgi:hypothetical protein
MSARYNPHAPFRKLAPSNLLLRKLANAQMLHGGESEITDVIASEGQPEESVLNEGPEAPKDDFNQCMSCAVKRKRGRPKGAKDRKKRIKRSLCKPTISFAMTSVQQNISRQPFFPPFQYQHAASQSGSDPRFLLGATHPQTSIPALIEPLDTHIFGFLHSSRYGTPRHRHDLPNFQPRPNDYWVDTCQMQELDEGHRDLLEHENVHLLESDVEWVDKTWLCLHMKLVHRRIPEPDLRLLRL